jgi:AraC-like DNA-binding protein
MQGQLAMSKTQLHLKIKALTGETPGELLRNFRLKRAAQLLSQKADTVTQIAYQVGFNNLSYFAKCFKALYGVSPSSY